MIIRSLFNRMTIFICKYIMLRLYTIWRTSSTYFSIIKQMIILTTQIIYGLSRLRDGGLVSKHMIMNFFIYFFSHVFTLYFFFLLPLMCLCLPLVRLVPLFATPQRLFSFLGTG